VILDQIEEAIQALDGCRDSIQNGIKDSGWQVDRPSEPIAERRSPWPVDLKLEEYVPEQRPIPQEIMREYQKWYSACRVILEKNQQGRLREFDGLYSEVRELLKGRYVAKAQQFRLLDLIDEQFNILWGVVSYVRFSVYDVELTAYSVVMDDELGAAGHLLTRGFLRPAGALAGVLLERYLKTLLRRHSPPIRYSKSATLSTLNDKCKDVVYDLVMWRKVQLLTDIRNLCDHDGEREPKRDEVDVLLRGVAEILHTTNPGRQ